MAAQIAVELIPDFSKLQTATEQLVSEGKLTKEFANMFQGATQPVEQFVDKTKATITDLANNASKMGKTISENLSKGVADGTNKAHNDFSKLQKDINNLAQSISKSGKVTATDIKTLTDLLKKAPKDFIDGFKGEFLATLKAAGVSVEEFDSALDKQVSTSKTLKQELKDLKIQMQQLADQGLTNTEQFEQLRTRAGHVADTISDINKEINRVGSDTRGIDTVIEGLNGVTAAAQIAMGASALLGVEDKALQSTLVKLNAVMAIANGLQQIGNLLQKESNVIMAISNIQKKLNVAQTTLAAAAESRFVIVRIAATVAQRALNAAMAANPAGLVLTAIVALVGAFAAFANSQKKAETAVDELNAKLELQKNLLSAQVDDLNQIKDQSIAAAKARNASESELHQIEVDNLGKLSLLYRSQTDERIRQLASVKGVHVGSIKTIEDAYTALFQVEEKVAKAGGDLDEKSTKRVELVKNFLQEIIQGFNNQNSVNSQITQSMFEEEARLNELAKKNTLAMAEYKVLVTKKFSREETDAKISQLKVERDIELQDANLTEGERKKIRQKALNDIRDLEREFAKRVETDKVAELEKETLIVKENTREEFEARRNFVREQLKLDLLNESLTSHQREVLKLKEKKAEEQLERDFVKTQLEMQKSILDAQLHALDISYEKRQELTINSLKVERDIELSQIVNNEAKRQEIIASYDEKIRQASLAIRREQLEEEVRLVERSANAEADARARAARRAANSASRNESKARFGQAKKDVKEQEDNEIASINTIAKTEQEVFQKRQQLLFEDRQRGLISERQYYDELGDLLDKHTKAQGDAEDSRVEAHQAANDKIKSLDKEALEFFLAQVSTFGDAVSTVIQAFNDAQDADIANKRQQLQDLRDANALTQKEFEERNKRLDILDRRAKRIQAEREKAMALFQATIQGATQIIESAANPFKLAATIALVTAQIAAIAARPIPQFGKGTKSAPRGLAVVGETGTEIIHTEKGYYVAEHEQIMWMKGGERIYNPKETKEIINTPIANKNLIQNSSIINNHTVNGIDIDYERLSKGIGDEIAKHPRNTISLDEHGFTIYQQQMGSKTKYLNKSFTFNG